MLRNMVAAVFILAVLGLTERLPAFDLNDVQAYITAWRQAWRSKDIESYMSFYSPAFRSGEFDHQGWLRKKARLFRRPGAISLEITDLKISIEGSYAIVRFVKYKEALSDYKRALNLKPDDAAIHNNLAWLYAMAKDEKFPDKGKALEHAKKAAELSKERNAEILDTLARAYFMNGKVKEAVESGKNAVKLAPENEGFKEKLEEYEKALTID